MIEAIMTNAKVVTLTPKIPLVDGTMEMDKLIEVILSTKRCHNSTGELNFVAWLYKYLETLKVKATPLAEGAIVVEVGVGGKTLFSCHLDTVHSNSESDGSLQTVFYDGSFGHIFCGDKKTTCLGADDGAGIYILLKMIEAGVKGTYIFHRGEEKGAISAHAIKSKHVDFLKKFNACIAFDRPGTDEVIIIQGGSECASKEYGNSLAVALSKQGLTYQTSTKGVFTDSKVYRSIIPECINIGVGYYDQHTNGEYQDWGHLITLTNVVCAVDWDALKPKRVPVPEPVWNPTKGGQYKGYYESEYEVRPKTKAAVFAKPSIPVEDLEGELDIDFETMSMTDIDDYTGDAEMTKGIMRLVVELDAERGRVSRLQMLLGM